MIKNLAENRKQFYYVKILECIFLNFPNKKMRICKAHHFVQNGKRKHHVVFIVLKKSWNSDLLGNRCSFVARSMIKSHLWLFVTTGTESKGEGTEVNFLQCYLLSDAMLPFGISSQPVYWRISSSAFHCVKIMKFLPHIVPSERVIFTLLQFASLCVHYLEVCCRNHLATSAHHGYIVWTGPLCLTGLYFPGLYAITMPKFYSKFPLNYRDIVNLKVSDH